MFNTSSMNYQCEPCSAAALESMLGPASASPVFLGAPTDNINGCLCLHGYQEAFPNSYMFGFGTDTFTSSPPAGNQSNYFADITPRSSDSSTPPVLDQEWHSPSNSAWDRTSVTPKLIQRQLKRREQNRASQRAFRERKENHAKCLQEKIDKLEVQLQEMDDENTNLQSQLTKLRDTKACDCGRTIKLISSESVMMQTSATTEASTLPKSITSELWKGKSLCIQCRDLSPNLGHSPDEGKIVGGNSQLFLP